MADPIIPQATDIIAPAIAALVALRPKAFPLVNVNTGNYAAMFEGLKAQATLAISRISDGVVGDNLAKASGDQLQAYMASEFELPSILTPIQAIGELALDRTSSMDLKVEGVIRKGTRFRRDPITTTPAILQACDYVASADVPILLNQDTAIIPIQAVTAGSNGNLPMFGIPYFPPLTPSDQLFDQNFSVVTWNAAGGSDGFDDQALRNYALAFAQSIFGPVDDEFILAALRASGVRHVLINGSTVYVADSSWGTSPEWINVVTQSMKNDDGMGPSIRFTVSGIISTPIQVHNTVMLRDANLLSSTVEFDTIISDALQSYFDDRKNFNVVDTISAEAAITRADNRIVQCTSTTFTNLDGSPYTASAFGHTFLANNAVFNTYIPPV